MSFSLTLASDINQIHVYPSEDIIAQEALAINFIQESYLTMKRHALFVQKCKYNPFSQTAKTWKHILHLIALVPNHIFSRKKKMNFLMISQRKVFLGNQLLFISTKKRMLVSIYLSPTCNLMYNITFQNSLYKNKRTGAVHHYATI